LKKHAEIPFKQNKHIHMKKLLLLPLMALLGLFFMQGTSEPVTVVEPRQDGVIPANVKAVIDQKCYGCHNANSKNDKAKAKLDWDALTKMKKAKRMAAMEEIAEVLDKGEMPPKKFLDFKPEAKLSESDLATLKEWSAGKKKKAKS
jgi:mono/diheme cytochrome c family protein